jgi:iron complex transport system substrate-binding protein
MRLVSLCPSITETLIALGGEHELVGITRFCIHPAAEVADICKVGGTKDPDITKIVALKPDLIFVNDEENRKEDFEALRAAGLSVHVSTLRKVDEVPAHLRELGDRLGTVRRANEFAADIEAELQALKQAQSLRSAPFRFAYLIWRQPWMAVGGDTYVSNLLTQAGGSNVFAGAEARYPELSLDELRAHAPDVLFLPDEPFPFAPKHVPDLQSVLPSMEIHLVSGDDCCWHGVRSLRGVKLATIFAKTL